MNIWIMLLQNMAWNTAHTKYTMQRYAARLIEHGLTSAPRYINETSMR